MLITNTKIAGILIDDIDADLNMCRWSLTTVGYPRRGVIAAGGQRRPGALHRIIASRMFGRPLQRTEEVDHINGNPLDNRRSNLRLATRSQNMRNQRKRKPRGTSHFVGIRFHESLSKWGAIIMLDYKQYHIGLFTDEEEAAWMRDQYAIALHGEYARLNFDYEPVPDKAAV